MAGPRRGKRGEGARKGARILIVEARYYDEIADALLAGAMKALEEAGAEADRISVPGSLEIPGAIAIAIDTAHWGRRSYDGAVALGCVIRGETPHFGFVAGEAASGLQLAAIETGVPVSFGLLTCETKEQAEARVGKGAEAARAALEMADLFTQVRTRASRSG